MDKTDLVKAAVIAGVGSYVIASELSKGLNAQTQQTPEPPAQTQQR